MNLGKENEQIEFKESLAQLDEGIKSLTAMLNRGNKGTVYFGIKDDGTFSKKIQIGKNTLLDIRTRLVDACRPRIDADISEISDEEGNVAIKVSAQGSDIPYSFKNGYYIRTLSRDEGVGPETLRSMLLSRDLDLICLQEAPFQELTFDYFLRVMRSRGLQASGSKGFYKSHLMLTKDGEFNYMAFLLSDQCNQSIKVVTFNGLDKSAMSTRNEFGGCCILKSSEEVLSFVKARNETKVDMSEGIRKDTPLFDFEAFREAWLNALVHNRWAERVPPSVFMFDDRIEVVSYGSLPYRLKKSNFFEGESMPINKGLFDIFILAGYAEQSGRGVPKIVSSYGEEAFKFDDLTVKVTMDFAFVPMMVSRRIARENEAETLTKNQKAVLHFLLENPKATIPEASSALHISTSAISKTTAKLRRLGLLKRNGSRKEGFWSN